MLNYKLNNKSVLKNSKSNNICYVKASFYAIYFSNILNILDFQLCFQHFMVAEFFVIPFNVLQYHLLSIFTLILFLVKYNESKQDGIMTSMPYKNSQIHQMEDNIFQILFIQQYQGLQQMVLITLKRQYKTNIHVKSDSKCIHF